MANIFTTGKSPVGKVNKQDFHLSILISCVIGATILLCYQYVLFMCNISMCIYNNLWNLFRSLSV